MNSRFCYVRQISSRLSIVPTDPDNQSSISYVIKPNSQLQIQLDSGKTLFVAGANGVGKSALLQEISQCFGDSDIVECFFGSRQINFQNEEVDQIGQDMKQFQDQIYNPNNVRRYRNPWGEQHLKSVIRRIINKENQANYELVESIGNVEPQSTLDQSSRIINDINRVFAFSKLPVRFTLIEGGLRAIRDGSIYTIDRLSDGERAALLLAGAILVRPVDSFIVIDEPERHLNPAISGPFLSELIRLRQDVGFIFSSHDLNLLQWLDPDDCIHVTNSSIISDHPETRQYDLYKFDLNSEVPDTLRSAVLGARKALLLVEGHLTSEDKALYGHVYPDWVVSAQGSCEQVKASVQALKNNDDLVWLKVAGLIDLDGREDREVSDLKQKNVYTLPCSSIENVF